MGTRLSILLWPLRMAGRVATGVVRRVAPGWREPEAPAHPMSPGAFAGGPTAGVGRAEAMAGPGAAYIKPAESTDGTTEDRITISQLEVRERLNRREELVLLDVRDAPSFDQGFIPGAVHMPLDQVGGRFQELDPGHTIIVYDASGRRSPEAVKVLKDLGFPRVHSLAGGFARWVRDGGAVGRPGEPAAMPS